MTGIWTQDCVGTANIQRSRAMLKMGIGTLRVVMGWYYSRYCQGCMFRGYASNIGSTLFEPNGLYSAAGSSHVKFLTVDR